MAEELQASQEELCRLDLLKFVILEIRMIWPFFFDFSYKDMYLCRAMIRS